MLLLGCLAIVAEACSTSEPDSNISSSPESREPTEAELIAQMEREAVEKKLEEDRDEFCDQWSELYCKAQFKCHPDVSAEQMLSCTNRVRPYCVDKYWGEPEIEVASQCFAAVKANFTCDTSLDELYWKYCPASEFLETKQDGESCTYGHSECAEGTVCFPSHFDEWGYLTSCRDKCSAQAGLGHDCVEMPCADGLHCAEGVDDRGLPIFRCEVKSEEEPVEEDPAPQCEPYEQYVESEARCVALSLPGEACGGAFMLNCVGSWCSNDTCITGSGRGKQCTAGSCGTPYTCEQTSNGGTQCASRISSCFQHPMLLSQ